MPSAINRPRREIEPFPLSSRGGCPSGRVVVLLPALDPALKGKNMDHVVRRVGSSNLVLGHGSGRSARLAIETSET